MARINIEDSFWFDPRLRLLQRKFKTDAEALGQIIMLWRLAQEQFKNGKLISEEQFRLSGLSEDLINCEWAERQDAGIYVRGSKEYFNWLLERKETGKRGGVASGVSRNTKKRESNKINNLTEAKRSKTNPLTLTLPLTLKKKDNYLKGGVVTHSPQFISFYIRAFKKRYGTNTRPLLDGKVLGQIKTLLKDMPVSRACDLVQVYLQMDDEWFLKKCHDFTTFVNNIQKVGLALDTGNRNPSKKQNRSMSEILKEKEVDGEC